MVVVSGPHSEGEEVGGVAPEVVEDTVNSIRAADIMGTYLSCSVPSLGLAASIGYRVPPTINPL